MSHLLICKFVDILYISKISIFLLYFRRDVGDSPTDCYTEDPDADINPSEEGKSFRSFNSSTIR